MKIITPTITIAIFVAIFVCVLSMADRAERAECYKWQDQAQEFESFYLLDWQQDQCDHHEIDVFQDQ